MSTENSPKKDETKALCQIAASGSLDNIYLFKVQDFTTILLGRFDNGKYFVQRGDGTRYEYDEHRIVWKRKLNCH